MGIEIGGRLGAETGHICEVKVPGAWLEKARSVCGPKGNELHFTAVAVAGIINAAEAPESSSATKLTPFMLKFKAGLPVGAPPQAVSAAYGIAPAVTPLALIESGV